MRRQARVRRLRNVFDQYSQPENQLTHALATALYEDERLLRRFVRDVAGIRGALPSGLEIVEQCLPGEHPVDEEDDRAKGLPDACIHDGDSWALLIESKVASPLTRDQLDRHMATARRRGLTEIVMMVITVDDHPVRLAAGTIDERWSAIYAWLRRQRDSEWARRAADFMEVAEARWSGGVYLKEGTLTEFAGFPFGPGNEYNYPEAKRVLRLAMQELRGRRELERKLDADLAAEGRSAITGKAASAVWDFIPLRGARANDAFTKRPHLTLSIESDSVTAFITLPNGMATSLRRNLIDLGEEGFLEVVGKVEANLRGVLRQVPDAVPWFRALQRHYRSQRAVPTVDADLQFDLRTAVSRGKAKARSRVSVQSQWLRAAFDVCAHRRSNYQIQIGARFPFGAGATKLGTRDATVLVSDAWIACKPILRAALGDL